MRAWLGIGFGLAASALAQAPGKLLQIERDVVLRGGNSHCVAWSRDGRWIASGGRCGEVLVVDAVTGRVVHELEASHDGIRRLAFSPDGTTLAVAGGDFSVWIVACGTQLARFDSTVPAVAWSADGRRLAFVDGTGLATVLDATSLSVVGKRVPASGGRCDCLALSPDGESLAVGGSGGWTSVFDMANLAAVTARDRDVWIRQIAWLDGDRLVRVSNEGDVLGCNEQAIRPLAVPQGMDAAGAHVLLWNSSQVIGLDAGGERRFAIDGGGAAAVRADGSWVRAAGDELCFYRDDAVQRRVTLSHRLAPQNGVLTADGRFGALRDAFGRVRLFDVATGDVVPTPADWRGLLIPYDAGPELVLWRESGPGPGAAPGRLSWWSIDLLRAGRMEPIRELPLAVDPRLPGGWPTLSRDGRFCALGNTLFDLIADGQVHWSADETTLGALLPATGGQSALSLFNPPVAKKRFLPRQKEEILLRLWGPRGQLAEARVEDTPLSGGYSPGGARVLCVSRIGVVFLAADTLEEQLSVAGAWSAAVWIDDERCLVQGRDAPVLELWDERGQPLEKRTLPGFARELAVDRAGRRVLAVLRDRAVVLRIGE